MSRERRQYRVQDEDGAYTIETVSVLVLFFAMIGIITQIFVVMGSGILVEHALSIASQEASARGAVDATVYAEFQSMLPGYIQAQCNDPVVNPDYCLYTDSQEWSQIDRIVGVGANTEATSGTTAEVSFTWAEDLGLLGFLGQKDEIVITRTAIVASQSVQTEDSP